MVGGRLVRLTFLALYAAALLLLGLTGHGELALTLAPAALLSALPLLGRFPGEARIVARRLGAATLARRGTRTRELPRAADFASLLERCVAPVRGPPAAA